MPSEKKHIQCIVKDLYYPTMITGSGVMVMHGMERELGDLDVMMATRNWFRFYDFSREVANPTTYEERAWELITTGPGDHIRQADPPYLESIMYGLKVNIFFCWRTRGFGDIDVNRMWRQSEVIDGVRCTTLKALLEWKLSTRREKDVPDILAMLDKQPELIVGSDSTRTVR